MYLLYVVEITDDHEMKAHDCVVFFSSWYWGAHSDTPNLACTDPEMGGGEGGDRQSHISWGQILQAVIK